MTKETAERIAGDIASDVVLNVARRLGQHPEVRKLFVVELRHAMDDAFYALEEAISVLLSDQMEVLWRRVP